MIAKGHFYQLFRKKTACIPVLRHREIPHPEIWYNNCQSIDCCVVQQGYYPRFREKVFVMSIRFLVVCVLVALLQCVACPQSVSGQVFFSDDFEGSSPLDTWTAYNCGPAGAEPWQTANGGTVTLSGGEKYSGSKSLQCDWNSGDYAVGVRKNVDLDRNVYVRWYAKYEEGWDFGAHGEQKYMILYGTRNGVARDLRIGFYNQYTLGRPFLSFYTSETGAASGDTVFGAEDFIPETGQWYCIEIYVKVHPTEGAFRLWVDGVEYELWNKGTFYDWWDGIIIQPVNIDTGDVDIDEIHLSTQLNNQNATRKIWVDDMVISDSYIGPIDGGSQSPTFTNISVSPSRVSTNQDYNTSIISFTASESLVAPPTVVIGGSYEATLESQDGLDYSFSYVADGTETEGVHSIAISGTDGDGNQGEDTSAQLEFDFTQPNPPSGISIE